MTDWYDVTGAPATSSAGDSATIRAEFSSIASGISAKLPALTSNGNEVVVVNSGGTALTSTATPTLTGTNITGLPLSTGVTGTLPATNGGTGNASYAVGDLIYASTTTVLSKLADVATGNVLISGGVSTAPSYGKVGLTTHISGTLDIANGGTGQTTNTAAFDALAPTTTQGDIIYHNGTDNVRLAKGTALQYLRMNAGATAPEWTAATSIGDHCIVVTTGNAWGSTNTKVRRFTTTETSVGTDITYADSAANGGSFTINTAGLYYIGYWEIGTGAFARGVSLNSVQLTTNIQSITAANCLFYAHLVTAGDTYHMGGGVFSLAASDVIRAHGTGAGETDGNASVKLIIRKVGTA